MTDGFDLDRFLDAQDSGGTYGDAVAELRRGRKQSHWMWFVFPQLRGLGRSPAAQHFGIDELGEARSYLEHPVLGARLVECAQVLADLPGDDPVAVLGSVDAMKLRSSMTLFARAAPQQEVFQQVLDRYFDGTEDELTVEELRSPREMVDPGEDSR